MKDHLRANPLTPHQDRRELTLDFMKLFLSTEKLSRQRRIDSRFVLVEKDERLAARSHQHCKISLLERLEVKNNVDF